MNDCQAAFSSWFNSTSKCSSATSDFIYSLIKITYFSLASLILRNLSIKLYKYTRFLNHCINKIFQTSNLLCNEVLYLLFQHSVKKHFAHFSATNKRFMFRLSFSNVVRLRHPHRKHCQPGTRITVTSVSATPWALHTLHIHEWIN